MKRLTLYLQFAFLLACTAFSQSAFADVKIKTRQTMQGQTYENTTYIKGKRQRTERNMGAMSMIDILMCDLKQSVQIMPQSRSYLIDLWGQNQPATTQNAADKTTARNPQTPVEKGGVVTMTSTSKDTGERKQMFGYTARRILTTMETESSPDSCTPMKSKMQTDGWYIDFAYQLDCDNGRYNNYTPSTASGGCRDRFVTKNVGTAKLGYPVWQKMTMFDKDGKETYSMINEVVEISKAVLEASLFEIPADYKQVKDSQELYASAYSAGKNNSAMGNDDKPVNSGASNPVKNLPQSNTTVPATLGAKKPGVARIGLAAVKTSAVGEGMNAAQLASAIGATLAEYLKTPSVEIVQLEAKLPSQIDAEAKQKECDFVVYTNVAHKKGGGGLGGMFGKAAGNILGSAIPMAGGTGAAVAGHVAATAIYTAASMSESIKSKDEITLEIKMTQADAAVLTKQYKAKAKSDGEDIISPLIEQAAQAIVDAAKK
ncbi:MAG: DUF4412 domain-containing protein [Acidobacteriota bacterium]|nr:DUF4412 domain-containing protein [Acidobacteriota bacterium]